MKVSFDMTESYVKLTGCEILPPCQIWSLFVQSGMNSGNLNVYLFGMMRLVLGIKCYCISELTDLCLRM